MNVKRWLTTMLLVLCVGANALSIRHGHPDEYTVQEGDSLWSIAEQFLEKPWEWQTLWRNNPHIKNPNRLYPGAVIRFVDKSGRPYLEMIRRRTKRLSPRIHKRPLVNPVPPIPLELIKPFLNRSLVMDKEFLKFAPYVVGFSEEHAVGSEVSHIFVANLHTKPNQHFTIYRQGEAYREREAQGQPIIGYSAEYIADVQVVKSGDPATVIATELKHTIRIGDRLLLKRRNPYFLDFAPHPPRHKIHGKIIRIFGGLDRAGNNQVVVIDKGRCHGVSPGDVLATVRKGKRIVDPVSKLRKIKLPDERIADVMVFRTFRNMSFALAMKAWSPIHEYDSVEAP